MLFVGIDALAGEGYGVEQTKLIHAAIIETRGRYVLLAVSKDADRIDAAFKKSI